MDLLADHPLVDVAALNRFGCAAVQWAAAAGNVESCRWLQARGILLTHVNHARHGAVQKAAWKVRANPNRNPNPDPNPSPNP